jgi:hypothetical protein
MAVNSVGGINGGSATGSERAKAAAVDLVTLPAQVALVPAILVAGEVQSSKEKAAREKQRKDSLIINQWVAKIKADPSIVMDDDYLDKDPNSYAYRALETFMEKDSIGMKFPDALYQYFYQNTNSKMHDHEYTWFIRNRYIPITMLVDLYHRTLESVYPDDSFYDILQNERLPIDLLKKATKHPSKNVRMTAEIVLKARESQSGEKIGTKP